MICEKEISTLNRAFNLKTSVARVSVGLADKITVVLNTFFFCNDVNSCSGRKMEGNQWNHSWDDILQIPVPLI